LDKLVGIGGILGNYFSARELRTESWPDSFLRDCVFARFAPLWICVTCPPQRSAGLKIRPQQSQTNTNKLAFSKRGDALIGQEMFKVLDLANALEKKGTKVYHLELGNPRLKPPPGVIDETVRALTSGEAGYTSSSGLFELREAIAHRYNNKYGDFISEKNITISTANFLINQFLDLCCDRGDRVVFFTPAFPTYWAAAAHIGLDVVSIPLAEENRYELTLEDVEKAIRASPRAILVNSANNPTGAVYSKESLNRLYEACERNGIWLFSDDTYLDICFGSSAYSLAALGGEHLVVISSFSKVFSLPGYRTGYAISSPAVAEKLSLSVSTQVSCLPAFTQRGCVEGLNVIDDYTIKVRDRFEQATGLTVDIINQSGILTCSKPHSAFYVFVNIHRTDVDDMSFCQQLLDKYHTAVTPGRSFGEKYSNYVRVATCGELDYVREGVKRIVRLAQTLA